MKVTQAAFAKQMNVSRKTVTVWKREGRLIMTDNLIDEEATRAAFAENSGHRTKRLAGASERNTGGNNTAVQTRAYRPRYLDVPRPVFALAAFPESAAADLAIALLPLLPETEVQTIYDRCLASWRTAAAELADADFGPPAGKPSWGSHSLFTDPPNEDWQELAREAGLA